MSPSLPRRKTEITAQQSIISFNWYIHYGAIGSDKQGFNQSIFREERKKKKKKLFISAS